MKKMTTAQKVKLLKLQNKAVELQNKLYKVQQEWQTLYNTVTKLDGWEQFCNESGLPTSYKFGDLLC